jgi:hypothetical protein
VSPLIEREVQVTLSELNTTVRAIVHAARDGMTRPGGTGPVVADHRKPLLQRVATWFGLEG